MKYKIISTNVNGLYLYQNVLNGEFLICRNPHKKLVTFSTEKMAREFAQSYRHPSLGH